ncbi:SUMF1/EgtB/PvdO family nonheme iron enzyme [Desulfonema limicola]|nr:SUMF1/EgtB/PvdO family nonheme iron enzyme [Desulfonema limicola]
MKKIFSIVIPGLAVLFLFYSNISADRGIERIVTGKESRYALIIGNGAYKTAPLKNPVNDSRDMERTLKELNFDVIYRENADQRTMKQAISEFGEKLRQDRGTGLFYFAGHGIQVRGRNYLIPIDAKIETESDAEYESVDAGRILGKMEDAGNKLNIVILDACRNNPFARGFRSNPSGLAAMRGPVGSIIVYATAENSVAADGSERNGLFTKYLLRHIKTPGLKIQDVVMNTRIDVAQESGSKQIPYEYSSLMGNFYFAGNGGSVMPPAQVPVTPQPPVIPVTSDELTNSLGMKFVYIEPGSFMMGSPENEPGRDSDETRHRVTLTKGFYMQTTEVTQGQWRAVMGSSPSYFKNCGDNCPVETVSWEYVQEFIKKLNRKEGIDKYRLPTEAEWEYSARAGNKTAFANGQITEKECGKEPNLDKMGWYCGNAGSKTHPVGQKKPNDWGLYDMHGNVYEWCMDWKSDYPSGDVIDPAGPSEGSSRVYRGGAWSRYAQSCRSANRSSNLPGKRNSRLGFRLLRQP